MSKNKLFILAAIVIVIAAPIVYFKTKKTTTAVTYRTAQVTKGTLVATVSGTGNVVVNDSAKINPSITGTVANLHVTLGDTVKKGQQLFTITNDLLDITVQKANTTYLQAKQSLVTSQAALATAKVTYVSQTGVAGAAKALATLEQAKLDLVKSQSQLTLDQAALNASPSDAVTQQKVAVDQATITTNQNTVTSAQKAYDQTLAGTGAVTATAKAQLSAAETSVTAATQSVTSALADLNSQKKTAAERNVTAPIAGTVTTLNIANGDTLGSSGSAASATSAASISTAASSPIVIQNLATLKAVIQVNEVDIASVAVGQKVSLTFDAVSGLTLTGKIEKVDTVGTSTQGVVSYSATIGFDSLDPKVRPEMSVNAVITTQVKQDVLSIASTAVKSQSDGTSYVQIMVNGVPQNRTVTTGVASDTATEIISGLSEGDTVVTQTITATTTNQSTGGIPGGGGRGGFGGFGG